MSAGEVPEPDVLRVFLAQSSIGDAPIGMEIWVQELAVDLFSGAGNFSNPVKLIIE